MAAAKGIVIQISGDGESARRALEMVEEHLKQTSSEGKKDALELAEAMETLKGALETVGIAVGLREAVDVMKEMIGSSLELGETMVKTSARTGLAVETLSTLHYAAAITGSDFDGLVGAVSKMDKTIGQATQGNKTASAFLSKLGLDAKDLAGRSDGAEVAFKKFAQTLSATENPIRRVELATGLLAKQGAAMIPLLMEVGENWDGFTEKAKAAGVYLDGKGAAELAATNQRMQDLKQHIAGAGLQITEGFTPGLSQMLQVMSGGKGTMEEMTVWGQTLTRVMALVGETYYAAAAAVREFFVLTELGNLTAAGRHDEAMSKQMLSRGGEVEEHRRACLRSAPDGHSLSAGSGAGWRTPRRLRRYRRSGKETQRTLEGRSLPRRGCFAGAAGEVAGADAEAGR